MKPEMSLRDWFAGRAPTCSLYDYRRLCGWPDDLPEGDDEDEYRDTIVARLRVMPLDDRLAVEAEFAYRYADAMMARRLQ